MPYDERVRRALQSVAPSATAFRSTLETTIAQLEAMLADSRAAAARPGDRLAGELGSFASGRIDAGALAALVHAPVALDPATLQRAEQALDVLRGLLAHGDDLFLLRVAEDEDLREAVRLAYGALGRAYGAAHVAQPGRAAQPGTRPGTAGSYPYRRWNARERGIAPPLVIALPGALVHGPDLAEFLDGSTHLVLVADGPCAPAPLVRLITPRTLVVQTDDAAQLDVLAEYDGPAVGLLGGSDIACFRHDPRDGATLRARLHVERLPAAGERLRAIARDELAQLAALDQMTRAEAAAIPETVTAAPADPADRLAAWLLHHARPEGE